MAFKIVAQEEEPLLSRIRVKAELIFENATPSNAEVAKQIASSLKKDESLVVVKKIATHYGEKQADVDAVVYENKEAKESIEAKTKHMREAEKKAAEEAAKPAEEAKEEAPAEEKAEEAPAKEEKEEKKEEPAKEEAATEEKKEEAPAEEKSE